jgi:hypothetical protein
MNNILLTRILIACYFRYPANVFERDMASDSGKMGMSLRNYMYLLSL